MMKKKTYEVPVLTVTEIATEDIMLTSLIGQRLIESDQALGYGEIEWIEIDLN